MQLPLLFDAAGAGGVEAAARPQDQPLPSVAVRGESPASHRGQRGAPLTSPDDREYQEYLPEEQRSQPGCIAGRMQLEFDRGLLVFVRHPRARRYVIRVCPDGTVRVTLPRWGSRKEAAAFAARERVWIEKQQRRLEERSQRARLQDRSSLSGMLTSAGGQVLSQRELVERAKCELVPRLLELARIHNLSVARVSIRNQRSRWGSCSLRGHICLNWRLIALPDWVRDYVLVHELMHLKRMDHSSRFWKLVARACPDYQAARRYLRDH